MAPGRLRAQASDTSGFRLLGIMEIAYGMDVFEHDKPALDQFLERRQEHLDPFRLVNDLDPLRQVFREPQQV